MTATKTVFANCIQSPTSWRLDYLVNRIYLNQFLMSVESFQIANRNVLAKATVSF